MSYVPKTAPDHDLTGWPSGVKYIVMNEGAERFSFYGMKAILYIYLTILIQTTGVLEKLAESEASSKVHIFIAGVYALPVLGAIVADKLLGKYHTILSLSLVYCAGHACLALFENKLPGTYAGLALIAIGSGGIKPCVSAHVGDQFGRSNWHLINKVYQAFYFIINFGSTFSTLIVPVLYAKYGPGIAFGLPGILMAFATLFFWMGRKDFIHVPASPGGKLGFLDSVVGLFLFTPLFMFLFAPQIGVESALVRVSVSLLGIALGLSLFNYRQRIVEDDGFLAVIVYSLKSLFGSGEPKLGMQARDSAPDPGPLKDHWFFGAAAKRYGAEIAEGPLAVFRIISVFFMVSVFWMLFDQHASTWIEQAKQMHRELNILGWDWKPLPSQVSAVNPIMVMVFIPILVFGIFPAIEKIGIRLTPLRKMSFGMMLAGTAFVAVAMIQARIESVGEGMVPIAWQLVPYGLMTLSEVLVSITGLEFAYTQAPRRMKSIVMSFWLLCVSFGNWGASNLFHQWADWPLSRAFWVFAFMMFGAGAIFTVRALFYQYKEYTQ